MADPIRIGAPDGSVIEFPAGTSDDTIKTVMAKNYPAPAVAQAPSAPVAEEPKSTLQTIREAIHAPTRVLENAFLFGLGDRARAGMDAAIGNGTYGGNLAKEQEETAQFSEDHPIAAPAIQAAGGIATPLGVLGAASKGTTLGAKTVYGALAGGGVGAIQGALNSRDLTDVPQTARDAVKNAVLGAAVGGALPGTSKLIGSGYTAVANALRGGVNGVSRGAAKELIAAAQADGIPAVQAQMARLGPDATLADAGPAFLGKAQGASLNSDEGRSILQGALTARNEGTNARIMSDINGALGPAEDPQTVTNAIRAQRTAVDNANYPAALGNAPPVQTAPILRQLEDMIPRAVGNERRALTNLRGMLMTTERRPLLDAQGFPQYDNLGNPRFQEVPVSQNDAEVLHKVKQELDNVIQYDQPGLGVPAGALSRQQSALKMMRGQLNDTLEQQVPGYAAANRQSAALAQRADAVEAGTQYLGSGKTTPSPARFADEFEPLSQGEKIAFAKGSRGNIERVLGTKANDLQALRGELQGEGGWNTAKLATVHGQQAADDLMASVDRNLKFRDTYNKVVENSQTAQRTAAKEAMKPSPSTEIPFFNPNSTLYGNIAAGAKKGVMGVANALLRRDPTQSYGELARVLSASGAQRDRYIQSIADALTRRQSHAATAPIVGDRAALIAAILGNAYVRNGPMKRQPESLTQ